MTDTPPISRPPSRLDVVKVFIGDLARPITILLTAVSGSYATVATAHAVASAVAAGKAGPGEAAIFIGAVLGIASAIYIGKSVENYQIARVTGRPPADPPPAAATSKPLDPGELPESERIR